VYFGLERAKTAAGYLQQFEFTHFGLRTPMTSLTYRPPAELEIRLNETRADHVQPPATGFTHDGKLNLGPAVLLAFSLSAICWAAFAGVGFKLVH